MTTGPTDRFKRTVFRTFGALPKRVRLLLIRSMRPTWIAGSVAIIERDDGRWLFVKPVYRKGWMLPGGLVDRGEHPAATVVRELREELGITVEVVGEGGVIIDPQYFRLETVFRVALAADTDPDAMDIRTAELADLGWYHPSSPPELEDETGEVIVLARQVAEGGSPVRIRADRES